MKKRIKNFKDFKLIKEEEELGSEFNSSEPEEEESEEETSAGDTENTEDVGEEGGLGGEPEKEEEPEPEINKYNEDPSYYMEEALKKVETRLNKLFSQESEEPEEPKSDNPEDRVEKQDPSSYIKAGVELIESKITKMPMGQTLVIKYADAEFTYHLMVSVNLIEAQPEEADMNMDTDLVESGGVKFKKYNSDGELLGELDKQKVNLDEINQDMLDQLNSDFDEKHDVSSNFEIEYGNEGPKEEEKEEKKED